MPGHSLALALVRTSLPPAPESDTTMPPTTSSADHSDHERRSEDRVVTLLQALMTSQQQGHAHISTQMGAIQADLKEAANKGGDLAIKVALLEVKLAAAEAKLIADQVEIRVLQAIVNRWSGWSAAGFCVIGVLGLIAAYLKFFVH